MNSTSRLLALAFVTGALASAVVSPVSGQQNGGRRGMGNAAEIERLERERREREMYARDMEERQFLLRNLKAEAPVKRPEPRLDVAQIRADFVRLQVVNNDLAKVVSRGGALDLKFVSKSTAEIRKLAGRLRENLALPELAAEMKGSETKRAPESGQLRPALSALDELILKFADELASSGVVQVDARMSAKARHKLEEIIALSGVVKKTCEKLEKVARL